MRIVLAERFQRDTAGLVDDQRAALFQAMLALPRAIGRPHLHQGLGIRKLHASGIWEARVGLGLRLVFALECERITLVRIGTHEEVRRFSGSCAVSGPGRASAPRRRRWLASLTVRFAA
jgi:mRNA-degrading endonuclease YafQ of YafQ-DinJ toxin-antitoxin module